jgi:hypothetical protein
LYLYDIKIQTDINQNGVEKYAGKSQFFQNYIIFFLIIFKKVTGPDPAQLCELGPYWPSYKAGLSPAAWAGLMFQPNKQTAGYCAQHSNQLNVI